MMNIASLLEKAGSKISDFLGERTEYGVKPESAFLKQINAYFEHYRLHTLLPYRSYNPDTQIFHNEDSVGFVIECHPMVGSTEEMQREISGLFQHTLPEGTNLQVILWADPRIEPILKNWAAPRRNQGQIFEKLADKRIEYFKERIFKAHINTPLRNFRCIIAFSQKGEISNSYDLDKILNLKAQVMTMLETLNVSASVMDASGLINLLDGLINFNKKTSPSSFKWNPFDSINEQIPAPGNSLHITNEGLLLDEDKYSIRAYTVRSEPDVWSLYAMNELLGDNLRDQSRVKCPFLIHYGIHSFSYPLWHPYSKARSYKNQSSK